MELIKSVNFLEKLKEDIVGLIDLNEFFYFLGGEDLDVDDYLEVLDFNKKDGNEK